MTSKVGTSAMSPASHARGGAATNSAKTDEPHQGPTRSRSTTELVRAPGVFRSSIDI